MNVSIPWLHSHLEILVIAAREEREGSKDGGKEEGMKKKGKRKMEGGEKWDREGAATGEGEGGLP